VPELPEVEAYRRLAAEHALGRVLTAVEAGDAWFLKGGVVAPDLDDLLGRRFTAARRRGKLLMLDLSPGDGPAVLGLRFGMTGRLVVDGHAGVERLLHSSNDPAARFDRFAVRFDDGGDLRVRDPRRLGGVLLDPREDDLGPDALTITTGQLERALTGSAAPLKARLLDQARVAGVGNLIADEVLWRASLAPARPAGGLAPAEVRRLRRHLVDGIATLIERGGSHTGDLGPHRRPGGRCPRDGSHLRRSTVGGRTTWWCPRHQR
jgi:formamidopyrimidine-DNA glycosylase